MYTEIDTIEKAYKSLNLDPNVRPIITNVAPQFVGLLENIHDACIVSEAIREKWVPDYQTATPKYESWIYLRKTEDNPSGFRFGASLYSLAITYSVLGPLLCQETSEKDQFFTTTFSPLLSKIANHALLKNLENNI